MLLDRPLFRPIFDAVEARLEKLVTTQDASPDKNIALLGSLLGLTPLEQELLKLASAIEASTIGSRPFAHFSKPARQVQALMAGFQLTSDHELRHFLSSESQTPGLAFIDRVHLAVRESPYPLRCTQEQS